MDYVFFVLFQGKDEGRDDAGTPAPSKGDKKLTNQFNFSERASQTYNNPYRVSGSTDLQLLYRKFTYIKSLHSSKDVYSYCCLHPLSNEQKSMFKSGDSHAV